MSFYDFKFNKLNFEFFILLKSFFTVILYQGNLIILFNYLSKINISSSSNDGNQYIISLNLKYRQYPNKYTNI